MLGKTRAAAQLALLLSLPASAWCNSFYVGAEGGPAMADFKQTSAVVSSGFNVKNQAHFSGTGLLGALFAGYAYSHKQLYLAAEANINANSLDFQSFNHEYIHTSFSDTNYKMQHGFGISALPGYWVTDTTLFYGRLAYANSNFKITTTDVSLANINRNLSGFRFGFGINQVLAQHISARMEYNHTSYQSTSVATLDPLSGVSKSARISPEADQVMFGLSYSFA